MKGYAKGHHPDKTRHSPFRSSQDSVFEERLTGKELRRLLIKVGLLSVALTLLILGLWSRANPNYEAQLVEQNRQQILNYYSSLHPTRHRKRPFRFQVSRQKAVILVLCRNDDLDALLRTLANFETKFNKAYAYPYLFLNDQPFAPNFIRAVNRAIRSKSGAKIEFGRVPAEHWSYPPWINQTRAREAREDMARRNIIYGGSESYRFMCRYFSGFFFDHPLLKSYEYYWRLEPGVEFFCKIPFDPFLAMIEEKKLYGFVILMKEIPETIPTLWETTVNGFMKEYPEYVQPGSSFLSFFSHGSSYNGCHFWSNFEIGALSFFRSPAYSAYFDYLDRAGGFFYERWGDAPVHSLAVGMFLSRDQVYYFDEIGYKHEPFGHCPADIVWRAEQKCSCDPFDPMEISHGQCQIDWDNIDGPLQ
jgi:alpha 1,2-mannosyltransferase